jgi:5-methylcytosine-specific restriction enzyme subunit McrC
VQIPIRNIYYLLSYAWKYYKPSDIRKIDQKDFDNDTEFFVAIFDLTLSKYVKKGLHRDYIEKKETLKTIREKIDFNSTLKTLGFKSKKIDCVYDEYSSNNLNNQLIYSTIHSVLKAKISSQLKQSIKKKIVFFNDVSRVKIDKILINGVRPVRGNSTLNFLTNICKYIHYNLGFDEKEGKYDLGDFVKNKMGMAAVFENFALNFYKSKFPQSEVRSELIKWDSDTEDSTYPKMKTDITIRNENKVIVIDTKYYENMFQYHYLNPDKPKFRSGNIYQLYTYLNNLKEDKTIEGMLLYPNTTSTIRNERIVSGKKIMINNINLNQYWKKIEEEMLELVE